MAVSNDVSHEPGVFGFMTHVGHLQADCQEPGSAVTAATLKRAATNFAAW